MVFLPVRGGGEESLLSLRLGQGTALTPHCGVIHSRAQFDSPRFSFCLVAQDFSSLSMITSVLNPFTVLLFRKLSLSGTLHRMVCLSALQIPSAICRWRDLVLTLSHILLVLRTAQKVQGSKPGAKNASHFLTALQIPSAICRWRALVLTLSHIFACPPDCAKSAGIKTRG